MAQITYIISRINSSVGFEHLFEQLKNRKVSFNVVLLNPHPSVLYKQLKYLNVDVIEVTYTGKKDFLRVLFTLVRLFKKNKPKIIHSHLIDAGLIAGIAGWLTSVKLRVYTRHNGDMHFYEHKVGRLYDILIHKCYHKIIGLSSGHLKLLKSKENLTDKVQLIYNFFDKKYFEVTSNQIQEMKTKYEFSDDVIKIGINARWTEWKGVEYAILAFDQLLKKNYNAKLYLFNASGDNALAIYNRLSGIPKKHYEVVVFESSMNVIYRSLDYFIHVPIRETAESFGLVYIEAMISNLPCVFTLSGIACDVVKDEENALVVDYENSEQITDALIKYIEEPSFRKKIVQENEKLLEVFAIEKHVDKLLELYNI